MNLTPQNLAHMYTMLKGLRPFNRWKLPPLEEIRFEVTNDVDSLGTYCFIEDIHVITISRAKNGHLDTIIKTLAHEIIHMCRGKHPYKYLVHDAYFLKRSQAVALEFGFDPLEL